jgi:hypothetical protein
MSAFNDTRPSLVCRFTRIRAALTSPAASGIRQHCATCADCRQYFAQAEQLESGLRRQSSAITAIAPGALESRILNAVERSNRPERPPQRTLSWAVAGIAAAAVAAFVVVKVQPPSTGAPVQAASVDDVLAVAKELPQQWWATVEPGTKLLQENPLQTEIASVSSDARSALNFLALNFLPARAETAPASRPMSLPRSSG